MDAADDRTAIIAPETKKQYGQIAAEIVKHETAVRRSSASVSADAAPTAE